MTLAKIDIIRTIQHENGYTLNYSSKIIETMLEPIKFTLEAGENILISGFGKFCVKDKNVRRGRSPVSGDDMTLDARKVVTA